MDIPTCICLPRTIRDGFPRLFTLPCERLPPPQEVDGHAKIPEAIGTILSPALVKGIDV